MLRTISVRHLLDLLEGEDPDARVIFSTDYGDHSHTQQALPLRGESEHVKVEQSAYSDSGFALVIDDDADDDETNDQTYLLIR